MRIMLDTNVLISILVFKSETLKNVLVNITDNHILVLSSYVIEELRNVVAKKFPKRLKDLDIFLYNLPFETCYTPDIIIENFANIRDIKDLPVLYSSIISDVDILITGDKDFEDLNIEKPEILTPSEFLNKYYRG